MEKFFLTYVNPKVVNSPNIQLPNRNCNPQIRENESVPIGDNFLPAQDSLCIMSINENTLLMHNDFHKLHLLCNELKKAKVDIVGLQEVNLNLLQRNIKNK